MKHAFFGGFLLLDKPLGMTSAHAVAIAKRLVRERLTAELGEREKQAIKQLKIGHAGTLDPLASGLLPLALGEATKALRFVTNAMKTYEFTVAFGEQRSTDDAEGEVVARHDYRPTQAEIERVLPRFTGRIEQMPPIYSALKVDGERAYDLARRGEAVSLKARPVEIHALRFLGMEDADKAKFSVDCGKGTYIRSLARDMALALGTVGHVSALRRTRVGKFRVEDAFLLENQGKREHSPAALRVMPLLAALDDIPALAVDVQLATRLRQGQKLALVTLAVHPATRETLERHREYLLNGGPVCVMHAGMPVGIAEVAEGAVKPVRLFNL